MCDLYIWLSYRFPEQFPDQDLVEQARTECSAFIALVSARPGPLSPVERGVMVIPTQHNNRDGDGGTIKFYCPCARQSKLAWDTLVT